MKKERKLAIQLLDEVEELLEEHGIKIADSDREGEEDEACLFGSTYYALEDKFTKLIEDWK